jgi:enoyl-CoA hydratase
MVEASPAIVTSRIGSIAVIRFNNPAARNSLSTATLHELERILSTLTIDDNVDALIFTGTDDVFASGANIRELAKLDSTSASFQNWANA